MTLITTNPNPNSQEDTAATATATTTHQPNPPSKKQINLIRGWPSPSLLASSLLRSAAHALLSDPSVSVPALQYGPDPGYQPLREELSRWLNRAYHYHHYPRDNNNNIPDPNPAAGASVGGGGAGGRGAEEICITGGASQSVANILASFTDPSYTRAVWAVAPCYFLACPIFEDGGFGGRLRAVREDEEGVDVQALERGLREMEGEGERGGGGGGGGGGGMPAYKNPSPDRKIYQHIIYAVPTCANPSGKSMSLRRRQALVNLARQYDALIICDDVYDFLQWPVLPPNLDPAANSPATSVPIPGPLLPRLSDIDIPLGPTRHDPPGKHFGHAISNGSFSKLVGPGVRTGWVHGTADFAHGLSATGSSRSGGAPSQLTAAMIHQILASGDIDRHLEHKVRPGLQSRHAVATEAVRRELGWAGVEILETSEKGRGTFGGYFLWLTLPEGFDGNEVADRALREENLIVAPGNNFEVTGDEGTATFPRNLRLTFSWEEETDLVEGIERLGAVLRRIANGDEVAGGPRVDGTTATFK